MDCRRRRTAVNIQINLVFLSWSFQTLKLQHLEIILILSPAELWVISGHLWLFFLRQLECRKTLVWWSVEGNQTNETSIVPKVHEGFMDGEQHCLISPLMFLLKKLIICSICRGRRGFLREGFEFVDVKGKLVSRSSGFYLFPVLRL